MRTGEEDGGDDADDPVAAFQRELTEAIEEQRRGEGEGRDDDDDDERPMEMESFVDDDGTTYDWDGKLGRFVERGTTTTTTTTTAGVYDESVMTYDASAVHGADEREVREATETFDALNAEAVAEERGKEDRKRARQREHAIEKARAKAKKAKEAKEADGVKTFAKNNTAVYVTGLPKDVSEEELHEAFKKCGVVKLDASTGGPRVKVYRDEDGNVKGDGLVVFLKAPSVDLAITLLDQTELRFGDASTKLSVSAAKFDAKSAKESGDGDGDGGTRPQQSTGGGGGGGAPRKKMTKDERRRAAAMLKKQEQQALGWSGFDDAVVEKKVIVVLKHMFTLEEMYADVNLRGELEEDVMDEAKKCGEVLSIKTYTTTKDGVMTLRFRTIADAKTCISQWNGRWFDGRQIVASLWDGKSKFVDGNAESEEAQKARLDAYAAELGGSDDDEDEDEGEDDDDDDDDET